jgi:hypothetical protein
MTTKRQILLPPYLSDVPMWDDFVAGVDTVWDTNIDQPTSNFGKLRELYIIPPATATKIANREMLDSVADFDIFEKSILVEQVNLLGMILANTALVDDTDLQRIFRNLSKFWYSKGTFNFIDFIGFCLNAIFTMNNLWTTDYIHFILESEVPVGGKLWEGGTYYPTTHIALSFDGSKFAGVNVDTLIKFFYEFANYNLVLREIDYTADIPVVGDDDPRIAYIVALGGIEVNTDWLATTNGM